jgi:hypothetical protein
MATILQWLTRAVVSMMGGERLALSVISLIVERIRGIKQRFADLAARISAGQYTPRRRTTPPQKRPGQPPPPKSPLPNTFGWLLKLVPQAVGYRSQLEHLLRDSEMQALLAAAPTAMRRPLRSLCRMLGLPPPPILVLPPRPKPPPVPRAKREKPPPLARARLGFHKGLPPLFPWTPRLGGKPPAKKSA